MIAKTGDTGSYWARINRRVRILPDRLEVTADASQSPYVHPDGSFMRADPISTHLPGLAQYLRFWGSLCLLFLLSCLDVSSLYACEAQRDTADVGSEALHQEAPYVYIDCNRCDYNHIRREITFVNYVRDPEQADVHVFVTDEGTGGGGREYELSFIGRQAFEDVDYTLVHSIGRNATQDETRESLNRVLKMGFVPYVMQTPLASRLSVNYEGEGEGTSMQQAEEDPWDYWVFEVYAGRLYMGLESNQSEFDSRWGFYADRVTEDWKIRMRPYFNFDYVEIQQEDGEAVTSHNHRHGVDSYAIMSISDHWSTGLFSTYLTRNDRNIRHRFQANPGVEYSFFPYDEATRKSITLVYRLGYTQVDYYEETIFEQTRETLLNHRLEASVSVHQPWGDINTGLSGSHYFHDFAHRRAEFYGSISFRVTEGLSLNFQADFEMIQDQLSLPIGDTSLEEVLLNQRELATDFSLSGSIAISYSFGSDFANVVNTRF